LNAYDHSQDEDVECVSLKLVQMENATQLNLMQGSVYTFPEFEDEFYKRILFDDDVILTFNH
jgi:hypothetical protein